MTNAMERRGDPKRTARRVNDARVLSVTRRALQWAREREYAGWDPYDGLNSPVLSPLARGPLSRLVCLHLVNRAPVNLRPVLGVPRERTPMGVALFARTLLYLYEVSGTDQYLREAESLLEWLRGARAEDYAGSSWGYNFDWQNGTKFFLEAYDPCLVVSVFCGDAFLHHWRLTEAAASLETAAEVGEFITTDMNVERAGGHAVYSYTPHDEFVVVNANALAARYLAQLDSVGAADPNVSTPDECRRRADELVAFVVDVQTEDGAWYYSYPSADSHLTHDNFHTGYVVDSLRDYARVTPSATDAERAFRDGLAFYRHNLFEPDGAPRFDHESPYPRDAHSAAQGIRTFAVEDDSAGTARTVLAWSLSHLFDDSGYFYRRIGRLGDDRTPYMRWSQAWMCFALASYLCYTDENREVPEVAP